MNQHPRIANLRTVSVSTLAAVAALGAPGVASAANIQIGVSAVQAHATHADAALTRAESLFKHGNDSLGTKRCVISQNSQAWRWPTAR